MTMLTGILEWPQRAEGRVRQLNGSTLVQRADDPFVPLAFGQRFNLRNAVEVTVEVGGGASSAGGSAQTQRQPAYAGQPQRGGAHQPPHQHAGPHHAGLGGRAAYGQRGPADGSGGGGGRAVVRSIVSIEGLSPERYAEVKPFEELTSIDPQPRLTLEYPGCPASCRLIDLFCPIGRGQRGLIVSPPKAGKTTLLKDIATAVLRNHPDVHVVLLLVDERPEEVTDFKRTFADAEAAAWRAAGLSPPADRPARCRVIASSNDNEVEKHIGVSLLAIERAKRMAEAGKHVVVMLDSLTRLGRAFNQSRKYAGSGRTMTGGLDSRALEVPKQLFGAARNTEEAGSLTIIASCLVDTGSAADTVIFEEFKGTGNMELILDRKISERRLFPAINLAASGTRKEHLMMNEQELKTVTALRRRLLSMHPHQQVEQLLAAMQRYPTNSAMVGG